jgi:hypothetical protein
MKKPGPKEREDKELRIRLKEDKAESDVKTF